MIDSPPVSILQYHPLEAGKSYYLLVLIFHISIFNLYFIFRYPHKFN